jgi:N-acetyl-gamma-glutamyl-phosphate reductase
MVMPKNIYAVNSDLNLTLPSLSNNYSLVMHKYRQDQSSQTVSIVGARGYSGLELAKLLLRHPAVELTHCFATKDFRLTNDLLDARAAHVKCLTDEQILSNLTDIVFLATPAEVSMSLAPKILDQGKKVIDLSGAFRLKSSDMLKTYGFAQSAPATLGEAEYGLAPFCGPSTSRLIANPGCYASAVSLALIPLLKHDLIESDGLVIDAKSGTTGAGRKASESQLFAEVDGECLPYRVGKHQHMPEIQETVQKFTGVTIDPHMVTDLLPTKRGIIASIFAKSKTRDLGDIEKAFDAEYGQYALVRHGRNIAQLARLANVVGTPYTHFSYELIENKLYLFSTLDNLLKGAASQAVENMNRMLDLPLTYSLIEERN